MCLPKIAQSPALALVGLTFAPQTIQMGEVIFCYPSETSSSSGTHSLTGPHDCRMSTALLSLCSKLN